MENYYSLVQCVSLVMDRANQGGVERKTPPAVATRIFGDRKATSTHFRSRYDPSAGSGFSGNLFPIESETVPSWR